MTPHIQHLITHLQLTPHPEGGWYRETFRSAGTFEGAGDYPEGRNYFTSIYFLITSGNFSALHRIRSDESWHFYEGDPLEVVEITPAGELKKTILGNDLSKGHVFQYTVTAGNWFGSRVLAGGTYSLVGCTVAPGFDFRDFEMGEREAMCSVFPVHRKLIEEMTRQ